MARNSKSKIESFDPLINRKPYESPSLVPLPFLAINKHAQREISVDANIDSKYSVDELLNKYGSPLYIISEDRIRNDLYEFKKAFTWPDIETRIAYSVKTNYLPAVCAIIFEEGASAEIVSGMEYDLVEALGIPGSEIIFNGPYKTREEISRAFADGAIVNVDNFDELSMIEQIAEHIDKPARIGIRVSFKYGANAWTKFGFSDDNGDSDRALKRIARHPNLHLELLHNHSGTFLLLHDIYAYATDRLIDIARRARNLGLAPTMIDMGGGFPSINTLKPAYDLPSGSYRERGYLSQYGEVICSRLHKARELFGGRPTLVLEPGRAIVDASTHIAGRIVGMKEIPGRNRAIIVDIGVNLVPTACYYDHEVCTVDVGAEQYRGLLRPFSIFGPLCMQSDLIREQTLLPPVQIGEPLVISNVGAYCHTQSSQFIQSRPATVLLGKNGPELIRRRETWKDIFALDQIPSRLRGNGFKI